MSWVSSRSLSRRSGKRDTAADACRNHRELGVRRQPRAEVMQGRCCVGGGGGDAQWDLSARRWWCSDIRGAWPWPVWGQLEREAVLLLAAVSEVLPIRNLQPMVQQKGRRTCRAGLISMREGVAGSTRVTWICVRLGGHMADSVAGRRRRDEKT